MRSGIAQKSVEKIRCSGGGTGLDAVAIEEPLEIRVNGEPLAVTMRTPGDDARLAIGFLFSEGILGDRAELGTVAPCGRPGDDGFGNIIDVTPAAGVSFDIERVSTARRGTLTTAACGVCGRRAVDDLLSLAGQLNDAERVRIDVLTRAPEALKKLQRTFAETGGVHAAAAFDSNGELLFGFEDVGRHNAVDKVVGALVQEGSVRAPIIRGKRANAASDKARVLFVSGRTSFEIVQKAAMAGIGVVASVSAPTSLAIELAERANVCLIGFVRGAELNLYTHPERVVR